MYWSTVQNYVFLLTLAKLMRTFTDQMQKMLRVVLVYIIKHLWNMWSLGGAQYTSQNLCKFHIFLIIFWSKMYCQSHNFKWFSTMRHLWESARGESHKIQRTWKDTTFYFNFPLKRDR